MGTSYTDGSGTRIGVDFVDVLFAIVMGISATSVLDLEWFKWEPGFVWQSSFAFEMGVLLLGYATLITSWVGYHQSVRTSVQEIRNVPQWMTFIIDIILLACYLLILVKFDNFRFVLIMLVIVFCLYVVWDIYRQQQRESSDGGSNQRMGVSRFWTVYFGLLLAIYWLLDITDATLVVNNWIPIFGKHDILMVGNWTFLVLAFAGIILYRFHKEKLWLKPILDILMFQRP